MDISVWHQNVHVVFENGILQYVRPDNLSIRMLEFEILVVGKFYGSGVGFPDDEDTWSVLFRVRSSISAISVNNSHDTNVAGH